MPSKSSKCDHRAAAPVRRTGSDEGRGPQHAFRRTDISQNDTSSSRVRLTRRGFLRLLGAGPVLAAMRAEAGAPGMVLEGRVLDGMGGLYDPGRVLVRNGKVVRVGPAGEISIPEGAENAVFPGASILPGLINAHVHLTDRERDRESRAATFLTAGVTTLGDVGSPLSAVPELLDGTATTRVVCSGPMFCVPGGYPQPLHGGRWGVEAATPEQGRRMVARLREAGASMVKIAFDRGPQGLWPLLDRDTVLAVVDAAREANLPVRCHVEDLEGLGMAVETGVDVVEHVPSRGRNVFTGETGAKEPCVRYRELLEAMAGAKILWCPTLDVSTRSTWDGSGMFAAVRTFVEAGGAVALGTDYPFRGVEGGLPSREMDLLLRCGLTGMDVLCSATSRAASALGREDLGRLESGAVADILVVRGDPTNDPGCLRSVLAVFKDGAGI